MTYLHFTSPCVDALELKGGGGKGLHDHCMPSMQRTGVDSEELREPGRDPWGHRRHPRLATEMLARMKKAVSFGACYIQM